MVKAIKCDICNSFFELDKEKRWDEISFDKADSSGTQNEEYWEVCKKCKSKIKKFIKNLEEKDKKKKTGTIKT